MADLERQVVDVFRDAGWSLDAGRDADLVGRGSGHTYVIQVKAAAEGRPDRLVPLLAQAILEARKAAREYRGNAIPMAVVTTRRLSPRTLAQLAEFARVHAPDVGFGVIDAAGLRHFAGKGLESLNGRGPAPASPALSVDPKVDLFSDLNQWLLKVLLASYIDQPKQLNAPIGEYKNATQLARAACVSVMTVLRLLRELAAEGFLYEGRVPIRLLHVEELLQRWQTAAARPVGEIHTRWILPGDKPRRLKRAVGEQSNVCLALFAAADALGLGFVHGASVHLYHSDLGNADLRKMGLIRVEAGQAFDVVLRAPAARESVFRGAVDVGGMRSCDVLQVWLDVANHPSRGAEQARLIYRRLLKPAIERARDAAR